MERERSGLSMGSLAATILVLMSVPSARPAQDHGQFVVRITPVAGSTVVYSLLLAGMPMEHRRTKTVVSHSIGKDDALGLLVQTERDGEALVEVSQVVGNQQHPAVSGRGRNIVVKVVAGRSEFTGF